MKCETPALFSTLVCGFLPVSAGAMAVFALGSTVPVLSLCSAMAILALGSTVAVLALGSAVAILALGPAKTVRSLGTALTRVGASLLYGAFTRWTNACFDVFREHAYRRSQQDAHADYCK